MNVGVARERAWTIATRVRPYVPLTVLSIAIVSGALLWAGISYEDVFNLSAFNPLYYVTNAVFHEDWGHYSGNMELFVPFGAILTWYTSDRHVLLIVVTAHVLANVVAAATGQIGVGTSSMGLAVVAATLVRATGHSMFNASLESLQTAIAGVLVPAVLALLMVVLVVGGAGGVAHVHHFFGFLYGGAIEAMYVLGDREQEAQGRDIPKGIGR